MIVLAFRLVWAFARLLLSISWFMGTLIGYAIIVGARWAAKARTSRQAVVTYNRDRSR